MKFNAEMEVVRFGSEDVIATSGAIKFTTKGFGNGVAGDGYATYNGTKYTFGSYDDVTAFINAMNVTNAGISANGTTQSLRSTLRSETTGDGAGTKWNGTFVYDADATWTTGGKTYNGVFNKQ